MRRNRRRLPQRKRRIPTKTRVDLFWIVAIILLAVFLGFFSTRFIIYPIFFGGDMPTININGLLKNDETEEISPQGITTESAIQRNTADSVAKDIVEDNSLSAETTGKDTTDSINSIIKAGENSTSRTQTGEGYCIQFGSFTTAEGAAELKNSLHDSGIHADIIQKQGHYKVVGKLFPTKEEATNQRNQMNLSIYEGVFITRI